MFYCFLTVNLDETNVNVLPIHRKKLLLILLLMRFTARVLHRCNIIPTNSRRDKIHTFIILINYHQYIVVISISSLLISVYHQYIVDQYKKSNTLAVIYKIQSSHIIKSIFCKSSAKFDCKETLLVEVSWFEIGILNVE